MMMLAASIALIYIRNPQKVGIQGPICTQWADWSCASIDDKDDENDEKYFQLLF